MDLSSTQLEFDPVGQDARARAFLVLVLEADDALAGGARYSLDELDEITVGRGLKGESRQAAKTRVDGKRRLELRAAGPFLSREHAVFRRAGDGWTVEEVRSQNGVLVNWDQITAPRKLEPGDVVVMGRVYFIFQVEEIEEIPDVEICGREGEVSGLTTLVPGFAQRLARLRQEATRNTAITLVGETGTGKEVTAKAIHKLSGRTGDYIGINCGAIPKELIQSELFGHLKNAFTGAQQRAGYIRDAHQGTLLLDEIIAAPEQVQVALLRVIQERAVMPLGSSRPQPVDVRFIAAAQKPLGQAVDEGTFRQDLQARLATVTFELPPLRERIDDVGILLADVLRGMGVTAKDRPRLSSPAASRLLRHDWPMNIRELAQAVDVAWGNAREGEMGEMDFPQPSTQAGVPGARLKQQLVAHLRATKGNVAEVGRRMNKPRSTIHFFMDRYGLDPDTFRSD
jgi:transcriptional regulator with PAS, ATPase and Fis domain